MEEAKVFEDKTYGLFTKETNQVIPLKEINFEVDLSYTYSKITNILTYFNESSEASVNAVYYMPKSIRSSYADIEIYYGDLRVVGRVKEIVQAEEEFKHAVSEGKTATLATEKDRDPKSQRRDVMKIELGNIPSKTEVRIKIGILQDVYRLNSSIELRIPNTITLLYQRCKISTFDSSAGQAHYSSGNNLLQFLRLIQGLDKSKYKIEKLPYNWTLKLNVHTNDAKNFKFNCPTHPQLQFVGSEYRKNNFSTQKFELGTKGQLEYPLQDFIFSFSDSFTEKPVYNITHWNENKATPYAISLFFDPLAGRDIKNQKRKAVEDYQGEYIFLLDRSGSMTGLPIQMAKESLKIALKSLPEGCYFNVVSFGSSFRCLFDGSVALTDETCKEALEKISKFEADMGGTEIFTAIKSVYNERQCAGLQKNLILLTDGAVSNPSDIIEYVRKNGDFQRVFSIGIGTGYSEELVNGVAEAGNGIAVGVTDSVKLSETVIGLIENTFSSAVQVRHMKLSNCTAQYQIPHQDGRLYLYTANNSNITFSALLTEIHDLSKPIELTYEVEDMEGVTTVHRVAYDTEGIVESNVIHKIVANRLSNVLRNNPKRKSVYKPDRSERDDLLEIGLTNQILNQCTAFLAICEKCVNPFDPSNQKTIDIPSIYNNAAVKNQELTFLANVKTITGKHLSYEMSFTETIEDLKDRIYDTEGIPPDQQRMIITGKQIETGTFKENGIDGDIVIYLVLRLRGGDGPSIYFEINIRYMIDGTIDPKVYVCDATDHWESLFVQLEQKYKVPKEFIALKLAREIFSYAECKDKPIHFKVPERGLTTTFELYDIRVKKPELESDEGVFMRIIAMQAIEGCWKFTEDLYKLLRDNEMLQGTEFNKTGDAQAQPQDQQMDSDKPAEQERTDKRMTEVILTVLETKFKADEGKWKLIAKKAKKWLTKISTA